MTWSILNRVSSIWVAGVDEVGRGSLAGPVSVGVVLMRREQALELPKIRDSKRLSREGRKKVVFTHLFRVQENTLRWAVASVSARVVDDIGISAALRQAVRLGLQRVEADPRKTEVLLDGNLFAPREYRQRTIVRGDETIPLIALASSLAKLHRDRLMERHAKHLPGYGFERHVGYGTKAHYEALRKLGLSPIHRRSFIH